MASGHCRECRFHNGTSCPARGKISGGSLMGCFVPTTGISRDKHCKTCRFYDGAFCSSKKQKIGAGSVMSCHVAFA
jgi:hypothetical protein